jgi:hypothetical protein
VAAIRISLPDTVARRSGDLTKLIQTYIESEAATANQRRTVTRAPVKNNDEFKDILILG